MRSKSCLVTLTILLSSSLWCGPADAAWYWTHGTSGHLENEAAGFVRRGSGLVVDPAGESPTWVHFAVPTLGDATTGARYVRIKFNVVHAVDSQISRVRIYNGNVLVQAFTVSWDTLGVQTRTLDLGSVRNFNRGMGVSVRITAGPDSGIDRFIFNGVGANFVAMP